MNIEDYAKKLQQPIESDNKVLVFTFTFSTFKNGDLIATDRELGINISAKWEFIQTENGILITIQGFDIEKFGTTGLICKVIDLSRELSCLESAYDLCFGS